MIRIRPQRAPGESVDDLIEDPWRRYECEPDPEGCVVRFRDDEFSTLSRDVLYYARALEAPSPAISGRPLRTEFDASGRALSVELCPLDDDCLDPVQQRAWSSPIFVNFESGVGATRKVATRDRSPE